MSRENATLKPPARAIEREQFDQARRIHGGLWPLLVATLGVRLSRLPIPSKRLRRLLYRSRRCRWSVSFERSKEPRSVALVSLATTSTTLDASRT